MKKLILSIGVIVLSLAGRAQKPTTFLQNPESARPHGAYGWSVVSDEKFAVVSAADDVNINDGSVWVYRIQGDAMRDPQKLSPPRSQATGFFGNDLAIDGDNLLIGAYGMNEKKTMAGVVYYYHYDGIKWNFEQTLYASDAQPNDQFGHSVAIHGSFAVIGSPGSNNSSHQGKAYVFRLTGNEWSQEAVLTMPQRAPLYPAYGWDVDVQDNEIAVSAIYASGAQPQSGKVFLYRRGAGGWGLEAELHASDAGSMDLFGSSIALSASILAIGAPSNTGAGSAGQKTGAVYIYGKPGNTWVRQAKLTGDPGSNNHDRFGSAISLDGNMIAIGASQDDFMGKNTGAVYVFQAKGNSWVQENKFTGTLNHDHDHYGSAVSIRGKNMVVGARLGEQSDSIKDHGFVYYYTGVDQPLVYADVKEAADKNVSEMLFYPSPFIREGTLKIRTREEVELVCLYDMHGRFISKLAEDRSDNAPMSYTYHLSGELPAGLYILNVKLSNHTRSLMIRRE